MASQSWRGRFKDLAVHGALLVTLVGTYLGWLGWGRVQDPHAYQVLGAVATVTVFTTAAAWSSPRPTLTATVAFWFLFFVNIVDMGDEALWGVSAMFFGPPIWLALRTPALAIQQRRPTPPAPPAQPAPRLGLDEQVAAWRASQRRFG